MGCRMYRRPPTVTVLPLMSPSGGFMTIPFGRAADSRGKLLPSRRKAVDVATQNPDALPRSHSAQDVQNIADMFRGMFSIRLALQQLYKQVDDTTTKIGSDAYAVARTVYVGTKTPVARAHLATAASNLGRRFGRKPKPAGSSTTASPATPSTATPSSAAGSGVPGAKPETSPVPPAPSSAPHA